MARNKKDDSPSIFGGTMIIAGTAVGAGMFALPVVSSGMWFSWSLVFLVMTWFCMYHSGLMILETNLHYPVGSSFDTMASKTLGSKINIVNGLSISFLLYVVTYAYVSGSGSIINQTFKSVFDTDVSERISGTVFAIIIATVVWGSTKAVARINSVLLVLLVLTFLFVVASLIGYVDPEILFATPTDGGGTEQYFPFAFAALPFLLASFGYHGNVPSLMKYYGKRPRKIKKCLLYGSLLSLCIYITWQAAIFGNIPREDFKTIIEKGGNIGALLEAMVNLPVGNTLPLLLRIFTALAITSSFLGVTLGLFDFIADKFKFSDDPLGRFKTTLLTFVPPIVGGLLYPNGFIYAIGFAGLAATVWAVIVPALMAKSIRSMNAPGAYQVWGGSSLVYTIIIFGVINAFCQVLAMAGLLPTFA